MKIDRKFFFDAVRKSVFGGKLTQSQVSGMEAILAHWESGTYPNDKIDYLAYMLATAAHETSRHMVPVIETRMPYEEKNPSTDEAIRRLESSFARGRLTWVKRPYWRKDAEGKSWLGRGLVQITHRDNYERLGKLIGRDLVGNPDLALDQNVAVEIMFAGMFKGSFTNVKLSDKIDGVRERRDDDFNEYFGARAIINGKESASTVAKLALLFQDALRTVDG